MSQPAGWYDDPQDADVLRYWDGVQWTDHTSPRRRPGLGGGASAPSQGGGDVSTQRYGDGSSAHGSSPSYGGSSGQQSGGSSGQQYGGSQNQGPYGGQWSQSAPEHYGRDSGATTPDGQPLAGWWRRFFARILDGLLMSVVVGLLLFPVFAPDVIGDFQTWIDEIVNLPQGSTTAPTVPARIYTQLSRVGLVSAVLYLLYEVIMLKMASGTLGKLALGIRVRLRDQPGPLSWGTSAIRGLVWQGPNLLGVIPFGGGLGNLVTLLNGLWPLWDSKKQSLNDKVAKTNVVRKVSSRG